MSGEAWFNPGMCSNEDFFSCMGSFNNLCFQLKEKWLQGNSWKLSCFFASESVLSLNFLLFSLLFHTYWQLNSLLWSETHLKGKRKSVILCDSCYDSFQIVKFSKAFPSKLIASDAVFNSFLKLLNETLRCIRLSRSEALFLYWLQKLCDSRYTSWTSLVVGMCSD